MPDDFDRGQELLQSAIQALRAGDEGRSLSLLRDSVAASSFNPQAHYLLGAEYAGRKQYGDAVLHWTTAIEQDPSLTTAKLQLGLLWLTLGNPQAASVPLQPLTALPVDDAHRSFALALTALCRDDLVHAGEALREGLLLGVENAPLMSDMQRLLSAIDARLQVPPAGQAFMTEAGHVSHDMAISVYTRRGAGGG